MNFSQIAKLREKEIYTCLKFSHTASKAYYASIIILYNFSVFFSQITVCSKTVLCLHLTIKVLNVGSYFKEKIIQDKNIAESKLSADRFQSALTAFTDNSPLDKECIQLSV